MVNIMDIPHDLFNTIIESIELRDFAVMTAVSKNMHKELYKMQQMVKMVKTAHRMESISKAYDMVMKCKAAKKISFTFSYNWDCIDDIGFKFMLKLEKYMYQGTIFPSIAMCHQRTNFTAYNVCLFEKDQLLSWVAATLIPRWDDVTVICINKYIGAKNINEFQKIRQGLS